MNHSITDKAGIPEALSETKVSEKLRVLGKRGRQVCNCVLGLLVAGGLIGFVTLLRAPQKLLGKLQLKLGVFQWSSHEYGELTVLNKAVLVGVFVAVLLLAFGLVWLMRKVFVRCEAGHLLTHETARLIVIIGVINLCASITDLSFLSLLNSLFFLMFGWAVHLAVSLREERDLTI